MLEGTARLSGAACLGVMVLGRCTGSARQRPSAHRVVGGFWSARSLGSRSSVLALELMQAARCRRSDVSANHRCSPYDCTSRKVGQQVRPRQSFVRCVLSAKFQAEAARTVPMPSWRGARFSLCDVCVRRLPAHCHQARLLRVGLFDAYDARDGFDVLQP